VDTDQRYLQADAGENRDDGCTAVTAVLVGQKLIVAHVGDSRAVLYRSGQGARSLAAFGLGPWRVAHFRRKMRILLRPSAAPLRAALAARCLLPRYGARDGASQSRGRPCRPAGLGPCGWAEDAWPSAGRTGRVTRTGLRTSRRNLRAALASMLGMRPAARAAASAVRWPCGRIGQAAVGLGRALVTARAAAPRGYQRAAIPLALTCARARRVQRWHCPTTTSPIGRTSAAA
jgi:hypothetical protein